MVHFTLTASTSSPEKLAHQVFREVETVKVVERSQSGLQEWSREVEDHRYHPNPGGFLPQDRDIPGKDWRSSKSNLYRNVAYMGSGEYTGYTKNG